VNDSWAVIVVVREGTPLRPDLPLVDALARLQLEVQRLGGYLRLSGCGDELRELIDFTGLDDVLVVD
jgi:hypothetical protein